MSDHPAIRQASRWATAAVVICTCVAECVLFAGLLQLNWSAAYVALVHALILGLLIAWTRWMSRQSMNLRTPVLLIATTAVMGPIGSLGTLFSASLRYWYLRRSRPFEEWYRSLFPDDREDTWEEIALLVASASDRSDESGTRITPFADILSFGTFSEKQILLALITRNFRPQFAPILKMAMNDLNNAIRVQAATAVNKVENAFTNQLLKIQALLNDSPSDPDLHLSLARHYDDYAFAGILDRDREKECRTGALRHYQAYLEAWPEDKGAILAVGRLMMRDRRFAEAHEWFERAARISYNAGVNLWRIESLFRTGRFAEVRAAARDGRLLEEATNRGLVEATEALKLWRGDAA